MKIPRIFQILKPEGRWFIPVTFLTAVFSGLVFFILYISKAPPEYTTPGELPVQIAICPYL